LKFDLETIQKFTAFIALGDSAVAIALKLIAKVAEAKARGRAPTQEELHAIALDAQAEFDTLPLPAAAAQDGG